MGLRGYPYLNHLPTMNFDVGLPFTGINIVLWFKSRLHPVDNFYIPIVTTTTTILYFNFILHRFVLEFCSPPLLFARTMQPCRKCPLREKISGNHEAFLFISLYVLAFGSAGLKASLPAHGADQFDEKDLKETRQMSSLFNVLLLVVCIDGSVNLTFNV
ncbi:MFS transporter [Medicago truncatula]|uniref:MFS transporter n=1 Tax=Medicago truncatula TaxID=3880 RepID=G7IAC2_MEDTR|nr:MFS transporter [Medicago truncatula]